jgi:ribosomal RNA-processing protein 12
MVAASVAALSRLFFEFHAQLPFSMLSDLVQTVELFLTSNNREIVKSVLGFVKVTVVGLPEDMLRPRLSTLVPNMMVWSKEHKGRLRAKVKGILDRLIRRFGATDIERLVDEENRKLVVHIRKERGRKKKKKEGHEGDANGEGEKTPKANGGVFSNEFDRAVYGSDLSSDDSALNDASGIALTRKGTPRRRRNTTFTRIPERLSRGISIIREISSCDFTKIGQRQINCLPCVLASGKTWAKKLTLCNRNRLSGSSWSRENCLY